MSDTPFCEWKLKPWIILLVLFAAGVLGYSFWSALEAGRVKMSGYHLSLGNPAARQQRGHQAMGLGTLGHQALGHGPAGQQPLPRSTPSVPVPAARTANSAAQLVAMTNTYPQWQNSTAPNTYQLDAVTMPTPMGGIKFIGGTQSQGSSQFVAGTQAGIPSPSVQNTGSTLNFNWAADIVRPCVVEINAMRPSSASMTVADPNGARFIDPVDGVPDKFIGQVAFESVGSGVIVDPLGYVVTNHHVVAGATAIVLTRFQHKEGHYSARIIASDPGKDLALLQILGDGPFPAAALADSSLVEVGDWVLTVGNPFGLGHTVTAGIISGKRDSLLINGIDFKGLLQTDAPINKGSSGGPLVNVRGQIVGINTAIYAPTGVFNGTGFAIPSNRVGAFVARVMGANPGTVAVAMQTPANRAAAAVRGPANSGEVWLGVGVLDMTPDLAAKLSYPHAGGLYVSSLVLDSPADEAEIVRGDIVTAVLGQATQVIASLQDMLARLSPGQTVGVTIWRRGKTESLRLTTRVGRI